MWLLAGQWFSPGTMVSSTNKTDHHMIFLKYFWKWHENTITLTPNKTISELTASHLTDSQPIKLCLRHFIMLILFIINNQEKSVVMIWLEKLPLFYCSTHISTPVVIPDDDLTLEMKKAKFKDNLRKEMVSEIKMYYQEWVFFRWKNIFYINSTCTVI
jgi:hypothetical protein